jgi:hypothetical protein
VNKLLLILLFSQYAYSSLEDLKSFVSLFSPHKTNSSNIKTSGCKLSENKWIQILITHENFHENISFNKGCDLQGSFTVKYNTPFPISLKIRNPNYHELKGTMSIQVLFENKTYLLTNLQNFNLYKKNKTIPFEYKHKS